MCDAIWRFEGFAREIQKYFRLRFISKKMKSQKLKLKKSVISIYKVLNTNESSICLIEERRVDLAILSKIVGGFEVIVGTVEEEVVGSRRLCEGLSEEGSRVCGLLEEISTANGLREKRAELVTADGVFAGILLGIDCAET